MMPQAGVKLSVSQNDFPTRLVNNRFLFAALRWWRRRKVATARPVVNKGDRRGFGPVNHQKMILANGKRPVVGVLEGFRADERPIQSG
jgi:hypothetical protein